MTFCQAKVVVDPEFMYNYCVYDSEIATSLGITATVLLLVSQVLTVSLACEPVHSPSPSGRP